MEIVNKLDDPRILEFRSLKDKLVRNANTFIAESEKVVLKLLRSELKVIKLLCTFDFFERFESKILNRLNSTDNVFITSKSLMEGIVGHNLHHGIMALAQRPLNVDLSELESPIMVMNKLSSPENVGTIIRSCAAFGINSIIVDSQSCSPYSRRSVRVSMGNVFKVKIHTAVDLITTLNQLQSDTYQIVSTANIPEAVDINNFACSKKSLLVIGNEGYGIDKEILEISDHTVRIPIDSEVAALNAATAAGIFLYQFTNDSR